MQRKFLRSRARGRARADMLFRLPAELSSLAAKETPKPPRQTRKGKNSKEGKSSENQTVGVLFPSSCP